MSLARLKVHFGHGWSWVIVYFYSVCHWIIYFVILLGISVLESIYDVLCPICIPGILKGMRCFNMTTEKDRGYFISSSHSVFLKLLLLWNTFNQEFKWNFKSFPLDSGCTGNRLKCCCYVTISQFPLSIHTQHHCDLHPWKFWFSSVLLNLHKLNKPS